MDRQTIPCYIKLLNHVYPPSTSPGQCQTLPSLLHWQQHCWRIPHPWLSGMRAPLRRRRRRRCRPPSCGLQFYKPNRDTRTYQPSLLANSKGARNLRRAGAHAMHATKPPAFAQRTLLVFSKITAACDEYGHLYELAARSLVGLSMVALYGERRMVGSAWGRTIG